MTRKIIALCFVLALCLSLTAWVSAAQKDRFVYDEADLLTAAEEAALNRKLSQISQAYNAQVVVATYHSTNGKSMDRFVDHVYDSKGLGYGQNRDGVLLVVCMNLREYQIIGNGMASKAIDSSTCERIGDRIAPDLSDGDYAEAFDRFAEECDYYLDGYINGFPFDFGMNLVIALVIGLIVGLIVAFILKAQLKSVRGQNQAHAYVKPDSMRLTTRRDLYLYRNVSRTKIQKNTSSGSSRSRGGGSRSRGGGSF